jgi:hypothetical protein
MCVRFRFVALRSLTIFADAKMPEADGKLTEADKQKVIDWLGRKWTQSHCCPTAGKEIGSIQHFG